MPGIAGQLDKPHLRFVRDQRRPLQEGMLQEHIDLLPLRGIRCQTCEEAVKSALLGVEGVQQVAIDGSAGLAEIRWDSRDTELLDLVEAVRRAGYQVPTERIALTVTGMSCAGCVLTVTTALEDVPGVVQVVVNLRDNRADVDCLQGRVSPSDLEHAVEASGYHVPAPRLHAAL